MPSSARTLTGTHSLTCPPPLPASAHMQPLHRAAAMRLWRRCPPPPPRANCRAYCATQLFVVNRANFGHKLYINKIDSRDQGRFGKLVTGPSGAARAALLRLAL